MNDRATFLRVVEATWPAEQKQVFGPWTLRLSEGGGKRVTAATTEKTVTPEQIEAAVQQMRGLGQSALFSVEPEQDTDTKLADLGYDAVDETWIYHTPVSRLTQHQVPPVTAFPIWPPLQLARDIWADGGIGPDRVAVMERATCDKTTILGRMNDRAGGILYAGLSEGIVMVHALEILDWQRRNGLATHLMNAAAHWGAAHGASTIAVLVTRANAPANALYLRLGMTAMRGYHYRVKP